MPRTEPNFLPTAFCDWKEWRDAYAEFTAEFKASSKTASDELQLRIRLQRLGYIGIRLNDEMNYVRSDGNGT